MFLCFKININLWIFVGVIIYSTGSFAVLHEYKPFRTRYSNGTLSEEVHITFRVNTNYTTDRNIRKPVNIDPCISFTPVKPRFSMNGARMSDLKCAEFMVDLVNRETIRDREERCKVKRGQKPSEVPIRLIISKYSTKQGDYPHMAAIGWKIKAINKWAFLCGGSLISPSFVLTAAHCSKAMNRELESPGPDIVRLGTRDLENSKFESPVDINIKKFITNPYWKPPIKYFDIALVQLVAEVEFSKLIQPACLEGKYFTSRHEVTVSGWGITNEKSLKPSSEVQAGNVDIIESKYCDFLLLVYRDRNWGGLTDNQMCAGNINGGVDTCQGDSGGPLQVKIKDTKYEGSMHMIIGVTSFGHKCGRKDLPGVYTKISPFLDWIESVVWPKL
ncbi:serine protease snake-like isoform X1 [Pieris brassicae]|uniref:serine protease snake-like isoform X1 n=2 Tax=Pieris brassicae TaxID=7116 RepID=UPI001E662036|nr:serine protease snake-like isoform X1 [Pieris brassicae]